jgi:hypothetical protein
MSKKQNKKTTTKKTQAEGKTARASATATKGAAAKRGRKYTPADATSVSPAGSALADPRLPAVGTVIYKRDRYGAVRCECTIEEGGIRYNGNLYRSLSAAAMAAAKDLRLTNKTQNGYTFWGLSKPPGKTADPVTVIKHAWEVFERKVKAAIAGRVTDENRAAIHSAFLKHAEKLETMRGPVAV